MAFFSPNRPVSPKKGREYAQMAKAEQTGSDPPGEMSTTEFQKQQNSSTVDSVTKRVQELVEKINDSRTSDQKVIDSFQEKLTNKVAEICQQMKDHLYSVYEENSNEMQVKLQELSEVLESCTKLNNELLEASQALANVRDGLPLSKPLDH